ncbi:phosphopantetheine-binding protein [Streptomyces sp. NPDC001848]|uniref:phosphopantetheine-binding protein n=1 Tax=Streptomyces sp. NPDC001848 TaxID=3364618 RepID=UPI0036B09496
MTSSGNQPDAVPATGEQLRSALGSLIGLAPEQIEDDANLIRLGLGSLQMMRLITQWRRAGLTVTFQEMAEQPTFGWWNERISRELSARTERSG